GQSPFFLNYGFHPAIPLARELDVPAPAAKAFVRSYNDRMDEAKHLLEAAQQRTIEYYNRGKKDTTFKPGDSVLLSTKNLRQLATGPRKLLPRWVGPYPVKRMVGQAAAELVLPSNMRIHPTFHVSLLRPYRAAPDTLVTNGSNISSGNPGTSPDGPPPVDWLNNEPLYSVERILDYR
ncbi:hypothetical protein Vretimale_6086, partial [Volvox reticuliferus]